MSEGEFGREYFGRIDAGTDEAYVRATVRDKHELLFDEPSTLEVGAGNDDHPSPVDYLCASLAACQASVLTQALERARIGEFQLTVDWEIDNVGSEDVDEEMPSNTGNRVEHVRIDVRLEVPSDVEKRAQRCLDVYDTGCIVGQSYRAGIEYTPHTELIVTE